MFNSVLTSIKVELNLHVSQSQRVKVLSQRLKIDFRSAFLLNGNFGLEKSFRLVKDSVK